MFEELRHIIPINSFTQEPVPPAPIMEKPNVGIRWGQASAFEFSNQGAQSTNNNRNANPGNPSEPKPQKSPPMIEERVFNELDFRTFSISIGNADIRVTRQAIFENTRPVKQQVGPPPLKGMDPGYANFNITTRYILNFKLFPEGN